MKVTAVTSYMPFIPYLVALFDDETKFNIGTIGKLGTTESKYVVNASRLVKAMLAFALEPEEFAIELLVELEKCSKISSLGRSLQLPLVTLSNFFAVFELRCGKVICRPEDWANNVQALCDDPVKDLDNICLLVGHYLTHLLIAGTFI
jgi:hypothetical protein